MPDAVLVAQKVLFKMLKNAVEKMKKMNISQATIFPKEYRPWGWF